MKVFIVGKQCTGKLEVLNRLEELGCVVGRPFSNIEEYDPRIYMDPAYSMYSELDIERIFEQESYIYIHGCRERGVPNAHMIQFGLSLYTFDGAEVFSLTPEEFLAIQQKKFNEDILIVWLDNTRQDRYVRHNREDRLYNFDQREKEESICDSELCKQIYSVPSAGVLYFNNEVPERIAAIIYSILKHDDLLSIYINNFN